MDLTLVGPASMTGLAGTGICLPGTDGMQLQQLLVERRIELPLIALSAHRDIAMVVEMVRKGRWT